MKRRLLTGVGIALGFAFPAQGADLPRTTKAPIVAVAVAPTWTGFYVGGHAGYAWADQKYSVEGAGAWNTFFGFGGPTGVIAQNDRATLKPSGFAGGLQLGYNHQTGALVWGIEGDFTWTSLDGSQVTTVADPLGGGTLRYTYEAKTNWFATIRPRLGWASSNTLLYVTGGLAFGQVESSFRFFRSASLFNSLGSASTTRTGWTLGGGLEYMVTPNWTVKGEYQYIDLGSVDYRTFDTTFPTFFENVSMKTTIQHATVGVNYKF